MSDIQVGQLWVDNDPRLAKGGRKRYVRVTGILRDTAGDRFRPVSTGYRPATEDEIRAGLA